MAVVIIVVILSFLMIGSVCAEDNTTLKSNDGNDFNSIQGLIDDADPGDSIYLDDVNYVDNSSINIDKDINIYGSESTTLDAQSSSSIFNIKKGVNVNISGVKLVNGYSKSNGGSIVNEGKLSLTNSKIQNSKSDSYGGAIYNTGILNIENTYFDKNSAFDAGAVFSNNDLTITDCQFLNHKHLIRQEL